MTEFEAAMASACESALKEMLGQSGFASTVYHLSRNGVSLLDCARRASEFDDALSAVFNPVVATLIECKILNRFYKENAVDRSDWKDSLDFGDELRRAREAFNKAWIIRKHTERNQARPCKRLDLNRDA